MLQLVRRSLLIQLLSVYLLFVLVVLLGGMGVNALVEQRLSNDVQVSDQALAQDISLDTSSQLRDAENSLVALKDLVVQTRSPQGLAAIFQAYKAARSDVDYVYWLDPLGAINCSYPASTSGVGNCSSPDSSGAGGEFSPPTVVQRALLANGPVFEVGMAVEPTFNAGVIIAEPVRAPQSNHLLGIVAVNLSLSKLSAPLGTIVKAQQKQGQHLMISILDGDGVLIGSPDGQRILQLVSGELPGANQALQGKPVSLVGTGSDGRDWLFSSVPVKNVGWAVVVQRPASEALAVVEQFHLWLLAAALFFTLGGLLFWLLLVGRVIRPLQRLASQHQALPDSEQAISREASVLARRADAVGDLTRSLMRLEHDGLEKLGELRTLLETSKAVVKSLDPHAVVGQIIREARRLVDVQAAAVLLPDEHGVLRVLVSDGHHERYDDRLSLSAEQVSSAAVLALRDGEPVQKILSPEPPSFAYDDGFRSVLAIPIISRHAGSVVLLVHRTEPHPFEQNEIDLLLTFANYATLAWEHAVLYERSDERLREIARENARLYQQAAQESEFKTTLLAAVGHEVRTPLAAIKGHASTLLQEDITWPLEDQRHFLQTISGETDKLAQLVTNLLDLSRQEAGLLQLNLEATSVRDLVTRTLARFNQPEITFSVHIPDELPLVDVDSARVEVVLHNLVANALAYGENEVRISAAMRAESLVVSVADNGPGIVPDELPHVFERFYRARHGRQRHSGGTGLGLAICKAFIEAHSSTIWVEKSMQGTTFSFSLPLASMVLPVTGELTAVLREGDEG